MIAILKIEVNLDTSEVKAALDRLTHAMGDTTPLMMELAQIMSESTDRAFENETDPVTGAKWPKLNPDYKARLAEDGYTGSMLQRDGTLKTSIHQEYGHGYARNWIFCASCPSGVLSGIPPPHCQIGICGLMVTS